jgi:dTDP-4-dehydrorhamnose 3,5-epimerase
VTLDDVDHRQVYLPVGFAHGFVVLSEVADVVYRCSAYYDPALERGFAWDDPDVAIDWTVAEPSLSARDADAPRLAEIAADLPFVYSA